MSEYSQDLGKAAQRAFSSPTQLAAQRVGRRVSPNHLSNNSSSSKSVTSARSRRAASVITTADEAELFDQMISSTSVQVRSSSGSIGSNKKQKSSSVFPTALLESFASMDKNNKQQQPGSPGSLNSQHSNFSPAEYSPESNFFSPGGALSIAAPGRIQEEKTFKRTEQESGLSIPPLEEKKTADEAQEIAAARPHSAPPVVVTSNLMVSTIQEEEATATTSEAAAAAAATTEEAMPTVVEQQDNHDDAMTHLGTVDETEADDRVSHAPSSLSLQNIPSAASQPAVVETVESGDSDDIEDLKDPIQMFRGGRDEEAVLPSNNTKDEEDPVAAFRMDGKEVPQQVPDLVPQSSSSEMTADQGRISSAVAAAAQPEQTHSVEAQMESTLETDAVPQQDVGGNINPEQKSVEEQATVGEEPEKDRSLDLLDDFTKDKGVVDEVKLDTQDDDVSELPMLTTALDANAVEQKVDQSVDLLGENATAQETGDLMDVQDNHVDPEEPAPVEGLVQCADMVAGIPQQTSTIVEPKEETTGELLEFGDQAESSQESAAYVVPSEQNDDMLDLAVDKPQIPSAAEELNQAETKESLIVSEDEDEEETDAEEEAEAEEEDEIDEEAEAEEGVTTPMFFQFAVCHTTDSGGRVLEISRSAAKEPAKKQEPAQPVDLLDDMPQSQSAVDEPSKTASEDLIDFKNDVPIFSSATSGSAEYNAVNDHPMDFLNDSGVRDETKDGLIGVRNADQPALDQTRIESTQDQDTSLKATARAAGSPADSVDPCGVASATLENLGSFISQSSEKDGDALFLAMSGSEKKVRISQMVESLSTSLTGVALPDDQDQQDTCLPIWDTDDGCAPMWDSDADLRDDDELFQILAQKTVAFLQARLDTSRGTITIYLADRDEVKNLYPPGMRSQFLDALRYRLSLSPPKPVSALDVLVLKCQNFGLDVEGDKNPIIAAESMTYPLTFEVVDIGVKGLVGTQEDTEGTASTPEEENLSKNKAVSSGSLAVALTESSDGQAISSTAVETGEPVDKAPSAEENSPLQSAGEDGHEITVTEESRSGAIKKTPSISTQESIPKETTANTANSVPETPIMGSTEGVDAAQNIAAERNLARDSFVPAAPEQTLFTEDKADSATSTPFEAFTSIASQLQDSSPNTEPAAAPRSVSSTKRDSPPPETDVYRPHASEGGSAFAPPTSSSKTDTALTPEAAPVRINPFAGATYCPQAATAGPPTEITHQSLPLSAVSGLDSSVGGTDLKIDGNAMLRLQMEIREAEKLSRTSENPETAAFWRSHAKDLRDKFEALQRNSESTPRTIQHQSTAENPAEQPKGLQPDKAGQPSGDYYAMEENNPYQQYNVASAQSQMQSMEYESRMVDVIAPADLPGGYHFEAEIEGQRFLATVPAGGVQQGETFTCYMRELNSVAIDIPVGYWKDNMCHMCKHGLCHPTLWHGLFCPLVSLGQITHRLQLDFLGRPKYPGTEQRYTNRFVMLFVTISWAVLNIGLIYTFNYKWMRAMDITASDWTALALVNISMYGFAVFVAQSTRSSIREKFMIREERCYDLEDVMCASTCLPCTVAQMARHTANYNDYEAVCCSKTGLPDGVKVKHTADMKENGDFLV